MRVSPRSGRTRWRLSLLPAGAARVRSGVDCSRGTLRRARVLRSHPCAVAFVPARSPPPVPAEARRAVGSVAGAGRSRLGGADEPADVPCGFRILATSGSRLDYVHGRSPGRGLLHVRHECIHRRSPARGILHGAGPDDGVADSAWGASCSPSRRLRSSGGRFSVPFVPVRIGGCPAPQVPWLSGLRSFGKG